MTIILLCKYLQRVPISPIKKVLEFYGRNSLIIMVTHMDFRILYISILIALQFMESTDCSVGNGWNRFLGIHTQCYGYPDT